MGRIKVKSTWIYAVLSVVVAAYLTVMWILSTSAADRRVCTGVTITVHDTASYRFVTPEELARELGGFPRRAIVTPLSQLNIDSLERLLRSMDKIEQANVTILTDGRVHIDIHPMHPVARIFSSDGSSYYVSRSGKRIEADARYHLDVPVVVGDFPGCGLRVGSLMPLLDYISADTTLEQFISMIKVDSPNDIILVPIIRGHVINLGDTTNFEDKFKRVRTMYRKVMPARGWEYYDTISVKWGGQVVATRRNKILSEAEEIVETSNFETVDDETMHAPGQKMNDDKLIPVHKHQQPEAAKADSAKKTN